MKPNLSHVALLVSSVEKSASFLKEQGIESGSAEVFESEGTKEIYVGSYAEQSGLLLLLEAISEGPYQRAMEKRGPSLHHIAIDVEDLEECLKKAQGAGWKLHPVSEQSIKDCKTAWLYLKGIPTLIEVQSTKPSQKPSKITKIKLPFSEEQIPLFEVLGLASVVCSEKEVSLTVDGVRMSFSQLACY